MLRALTCICHGIVPGEGIKRCNLGSCGGGFDFEEMPTPLDLGELKSLDSLDFSKGTNHHASRQDQRAGPALPLKRQLFDELCAQAGLDGDIYDMLNPMLDRVAEDCWDSNTDIATAQTLALKLGFQTPPLCKGGGDEYDPESLDVCIGDQVELVNSDYESQLHQDMATSEAIEFGFVHGYRIEKRLLPVGWERIEAEGLVEEVRSRVQYEPSHKDETQQIIRFLIGADLDLNRVVELLDNQGRWRQFYGIDHVRSQAIRMRVDEFPYFQEFAEVLPFHPCATFSADGHPVAVFRVGCAQLDKLASLEQTKVVQLFRYMTQYLEHLVFRRSQTAGRLLGTITIFDLQGLQRKHLQHLRSVASKVVEPIVKDLLLYHLENDHHTFLLNVPRACFHMWHMWASLWLNERTMSKVTISSSVPERLFSTLGEDCLPSFLRSANRDPQHNLRPGDWVSNTQAV